MASTSTIQGVLATTANDTFIQTAINTGLTGTDNSAFRIKELLLDLPNFQGITANQRQEVQITRGTKNAIVSLSDTSLITFFRKFMNSLTSGVAIDTLTYDYVPQGDLIIVESQIFLGWKTTAFAALATVGYKLVLEEIKISADQRITILSSRLP